MINVSRHGRSQGNRQERNINATGSVLNIMAGADPWGGGGGPGGQEPPLFWGTPKLHKEGKNGAHVHVKTPRFST